MFVLDTNAISDLRKAKAGKANPGLVEWAECTPAVHMYMSVISLHELEHGILLLEHRDARQGGILRRWLEDSVLPAFEGRLLPVTAGIARSAAALHVPDPAPFRDALIAATAQVHDMTVLTRNVRDFERFPGSRVLNPWT